MKIRKNTLWKVPLFCAAASWLSFYLTVYLGRFFFVVKTVGEDGVTEVYADPVRSALFNGAVFVLILLIGGLWAFRSMSRAELVASAGIAATLYLLICVFQLAVSGTPGLGLWLSYIQNWTAILNSFLFSITGSLKLSALLSSFAPLLFIPFGRKRIKS